MINSVKSLLHSGSTGIVVDIECHLSNSLPNIVIVGLGNKAIDEAKERVRSAFASSKIALPRKRITINLAPADIPKESASFDLPIVAAILQAASQIKHTFGPNEAIVGELGLDGQVRAVRGIIGKLLVGQRNGIETFYIPTPNLQQALLVPHITLIPVASVEEFYHELNMQTPLKRHQTHEGRTPEIPPEKSSQHYLLSDVVGQQSAKRALEITAAGGHNIFLSGPPGTGKSMLAKALPSIMPPLNQTEMLEITHLHSLANNEYDKLMSTRPFRSPHHSASHAAIVGGGNTVRPGEISLSHQGVLFFDEMAEFSRSVIESLRQPLEDHVITIARAKESITYPANFILVGTANPCPCGYYGSARPCQCSAHKILQYRQKISGPILDRIDLYIEVEEIKHALLLTNSSHAENDIAVRTRVIKARASQAKRYGNTEKLNAHMTNQDIKKYAKLSGGAHELLNQAAGQLNISARGYMRVIKVARTIADIENAPAIEHAHIAEALQYRNKNTTTIE